MAMSVSSTIDESKISFNNNSLIEINNVSIGAGGEYTTSITNIDKKCDYIKLLVDVSVTNTELTTDDFHSVCASFAITYEETNADGNMTSTTKPSEDFFPKFQHEVSNKDTYSIVSVPVSKIKSIDITVNNFEEEAVTIDKLRVYYSAVMDEEVVEETVEQKIQSSLVIPILDEDPDPTKVPNGYMYILRTLL